MRAVRHHQDVPFQRTGQTLHTLKANHSKEGRRRHTTLMPASSELLLLLYWMLCPLSMHPFD